MGAVSLVAIQPGGLGSERVSEFTLPLGEVGSAGPVRGCEPFPDPFASEPTALWEGELEFSNTVAGACGKCWAG